MTRTDVVASSRPQIADAPARSRRAPWRTARGLASALAIAVALAAVPGTALAASGTSPKSGYEQEPNTPKTTPKSGTAPSKESEKPSTTPTTEPAPTTTPTTSESPEKAKTLPFTGFDLRWEIGLALLLIAAGASIVVLQRRQRRSGR
jgi:hypothetical protein